MDMGTLEGRCHLQCGLACGGHPPCDLGSKIRGSDLLWKRKGKDSASLGGSPRPPDPAPNRFSVKWKSICGHFQAESGEGHCAPSGGQSWSRTGCMGCASLHIHQPKEQGHTERIFKCRFWVTMATGETVKPKVQLSCSLFHINLGRKIASFPPSHTPVSWDVCFQGFKKQFPCSCRRESL